MGLCGSNSVHLKVLKKHLRIFLKIVAHPVWSYQMLLFDSFLILCTYVESFNLRKKHILRKPRCKKGAKVSYFFGHTTCLASSANAMFAQGVQMNWELLSKSVILRLGTMSISTTALWHQTISTTAFWHLFISTTIKLAPLIKCSKIYLTTWFCSKKCL